MNKEVKEVIIDNIDVSKCEYICVSPSLCPAKIMPYAKEPACFANCKIHNTRHNLCKNNPNCLFKQLIKSQQEVEDLKAEMQNRCDICDLVNENVNQGIKINELIQQLTQAKEENERLKEETSRATCPECGYSLLNSTGLILVEEKQQLVIDKIKLQQDLKVADKMIELMAGAITSFKLNCGYNSTDLVLLKQESIRNDNMPIVMEKIMYKAQALIELGEIADGQSVSEISEVEG